MIDTKGTQRGIIEKTCGNCGKTFIAQPYHIYRDDIPPRWYCSWTCYNHRNDGKPPKQWGRKRKRSKDNELN